ncbi:MAG: helix-turn-helix transcriptional regulator [Sphingomonas fennica]
MQGSDLRAIRKAAGLTQGQLADAVGLTLGFIGEMERGEKPVERRTALAVTFATRYPAEAAAVE